MCDEMTMEVEIDGDICERRIAEVRLGGQLVPQLREGESVMYRRAGMPVIVRAKDGYE